MIDFWKMQATGNDFVVIPDLEDRLTITPEAVRRLCDRHFGIGGDGIIRIGPGKSAPYFMDYRNADGSLAEMCGNGVRVLGKWLGDRQLVGDVFDLETRAGVRLLRMHRDGSGLVASVVIDMGLPTYGDNVTEHLKVGDRELALSLISMGNPHAVLFVDDVDATPLDIIGPLVQNSSRFPDGVNVEVAAVEPDGVIRERTFERGSGETLCCGTGACAVAVAGQRRGLVGERVEMEVRGGRLALEWRPGESVTLAGPAVETFAGNFDPADYGVTGHGLK